VCGIAGVAALDARPITPETVKRMCDALAHRGPDDGGYAYFRVPGEGTGRGAYWTQFVDPKFAHANEHLPVYGGSYFADEMSKLDFSLALGQRRLSIIDLSHAGHQPMSNSSRRLWVSYNGEIYNFRELRAELVSAGYVFRTQSDTEVLLHLWEEHGEAGLARLDGMFAFALYDTRDNRLVLARDRFGVKPLYWARSGERFLFASEVKGVLASGEHPARFDPTALAEYLTFQNVYGDDTLFEGVHLLPPGHVMTVRPGRGVVEPPRRFAPELPPVDPELDAETAREQVADAFSAAVKRQLVSDVEVGSYLSGGMDSGSIVSVAGRSIPRLLTFTGGFDLTNVNGIEQGFDERRIAEKLSYLLQTEHYDVVLHAGDMPAAMERITWHMDDPRVGMCHQNWYVAKLASKFVKVCLAGAGGDELFGGYPWRYRPAFETEDVEAFDRAYLSYWHRLLPKEELPGLLVPELADRLDIAPVRYQQVMAGAPEPDPRLSHLENTIQRALYFEYKTFLHGFLVTEDRISMAHSLETRVPFLDNALAELSWRLPPSLKVDTERLGKKASQAPGVGHIQSADGKKVLRRAMESFLPPEFTQQKKQGFSPPDENWFRGPSMDYIKAILYDRRALERPWFDQGFVRARLEEHFEGQRNHRLLIWSLLSVEWLQRHFIDG
jgi:asparagine synthase (glutamine-hydrolysing)